MNLEIGDKVVIKEDLTCGKYGKVLVTNHMVEYAGLTATLLEEKHPGVFNIDLDNKTWAWHKFMFKEKVDNNVPTYKVLYKKPYYIHDYVQKVIINGNATIVILETGEKGVAKCSPNDEFKVTIGYEIARSRARIKHYQNLIKGEQEFEQDFIKYMD